MLQVPSSPRGAEAWRADARRQRGASTSVESYNAPPPLPPKPSYARAPEVSTGAMSLDSSSPPPLPPKPDYARADPKPQLPPRPHTLFSDVPRRPLPPLPIPPRPQPLELSSCAVVGEPDDENVPPERSVVSDAITVPLEPRAFGMNSDVLSENLSDPNDIPDELELPIAPPPCSLYHASLPRLFGDPPLKKRDVFSLPAHNEHDVRSAAVEIAHKRARGRGRSRRDLRSPPRDQRVVCRSFEPSLPGAELQAVLDSAAGDGSERAMQLLVGYVIKAILHSPHQGSALFADALSRFRSSTDVRTRGLSFTLILNVAAQACFVRGRTQTGVVEAISLTLFADLVLGMRGTEMSRGVWDKATRCALVLYASDDMAPTARQRDALLVLAAHVHQHPDVTRLLFEHAERGDEVTRFFNDADDAVSLYTRTSSLSARRKLFRAIFRAAVDEATRDTAPLADEQSRWLLAILEAHDAANALVLEFRQGCASDFVLLLVRELFFASLQRQGADGEAIAPISEDDDASSRWGRSAVAVSAERDPADRVYELAARRHARAVRTANRALDKSFTIRVLRAIERRANAHAEARASADEACADHTALARTACRSAERAVLRLRCAAVASQHAAVACGAQLAALHDAAKLLVGARGAARAAASITELLLDAIMLSPTFSPLDTSPRSAAAPDTIAAQFLGGQRYVIRRMLVDVDAALLLALLTLSEPLWYECYVSQLRQCLVELVGAVQERASLLKPFVEDPDTAVAYRASIVYATYCETSSSSGSPSPPQKETGELLGRRREGPSQALNDAYTKVLFFKNAERTFV